MNRIAIYGAGGFGKEVKGMLDLMNIAFGGYIDDFKKTENSVTGKQYDDVLLAIADPGIRKNIIEDWSLEKVPFQPLISSDIALHPSVSVGKGSILCPGTKLTVEVVIGDFVIINLNSTIGHNVTIEDYCSIMPAVNISGNVILRSGVFIGVGASILQGITIGENAIIGAGAVVTKDVEPGKLVVGIPAKSV